MAWIRGQKARIARLAGVSPQYVSDILARRSRANPPTAKKLEKASKEAGNFIPRYDWMESKETSNPLFGPKEQ